MSESIHSPLSTPGAPPAPAAPAPAAAPAPPAAAPAAPQVPAEAESDGGSEETGLFARGGRPALNLVDPAQQAPAVPAADPAVAPAVPAVAPAVAPAADPAVPVAQAPVPPVEGLVQQQAIPAKDDTARFEHWQRQADIALNSDAMRIGKFIETQPDLYEAALARSKGQTAPLQALPERPVRPSKPTNYDVSDVNDPNTATGVYTAQFQEYLEKKDDYDISSEQHNAAQATRTAQQNQLIELGEGLVREGGLSRDEAQGAIDLFTSGRARDPKLLAELYKLSLKPDQSVQANQLRVNNLISSQPTLEAPAPVAVANGRSPAGIVDPQDLLSADMANRASVPDLILH